MFDTPEWRVIVSGRVNVLIEGSPSAVNMTLRRLRTEAHTPPIVWSDAETAAVASSILVLEVASLNEASQRALMDLIGTRRLNVIATSSTPVYEAVRERRFLSDLYYRLNQVRLVLR